jgi:hypothetical protein
LRLEPNPCYRALRVWEEPPRRTVRTWNWAPFDDGAFS